MRVCTSETRCQDGYLLEEIAAKCVEECEADRGYYLEKPSDIACSLCAGFV